MSTDRAAMSGEEFFTAHMNLIVDFATATQDDDTVMRMVATSFAYLLAQYIRGAGMLNDEIEAMLDDVFARVRTVTRGMLDQLDRQAD
jgi:hypothetical protein